MYLQETKQWRVIFFFVMLTRLPLKFVSAHVGSNYLCINLGMGSLAISKWKPFL